MRYRSLIRCLILAGLSLASLGSVFAQSGYPNRPLRFIVPFPPGGITDVFVRALGNEMQKTLGQPVVVENRPGANQIIGAEACARAVADGYTICLTGTDVNSLNPYLFTKLPYNPETDLAPVTPLFFLQEGLIVNPALKANSMAELIAIGKQRPELLNYGSFGEGSALQLFMEWFKSRTGVNAAHVPYRGGAPLVQALLSGEIQLVHFGLGNVTEQLKAGKLKLLSVSSQSRSPLFPSVPTLSELGIGDWPLRSWFGVAAPAGTPATIIERLNAEINRIVSNPDFQKARMTPHSFEAAPMSPAQFSEFVAKDRRNGGAIVKASGVTPQ